MRSRYAAFALGLGAYLVETLSADHPDREHDAGALATALSRAKETQRFMGLTILESSADGDEGEVIFHARIFERGIDRSFTERSRFRKEAGGWRYTGGDTTKHETPPASGRGSGSDTHDGPARGSWRASGRVR
jgi:SEC-C motif-containing protein